MDRKGPACPLSPFPRGLIQLDCRKGWLGVASHLQLNYVPPQGWEGKRLATSRAKAGTNFMMKKFKVRFWLKMLGLASAIALVSAILIASVGARAGAGSNESESATPAQSSVAESEVVPSDINQQTYEGIITDTHCSAKHSAAVGKTAADCTRVCVHSGERFALVDGDKMYVLEGKAAALKHAAGARVKIGGTLTGDTISVGSVEAPKS
jgi:hypothetical protein